MQTEQELLAGFLAIENGAGELVKIKQPQEKKHEFAVNHHGMMSGSSIGLIIIEPASKAEVKEAQNKVNVLWSQLLDKGVHPDKSTEEQAKAAKSVTLFKDYGIAKRALYRLQNTEFGETAKSYLDEIVSQRRRVFNPKRPKKFNGNAATRWGNNQEEESVRRFEAMQAYEGLTGLKLEKTGDKQEFIHLGYVELVGFDFSEWFGCTPDSVTPESYEYAVKFIGRDVKKIPREFKNPSSGVVFDRYRELKTPLDLKKENALYYWQCIAQMLCCDAHYMQWIAYDGDVINESERFVIVDFERDIEEEQVLINSLFKAVKYIKERI